MQNSADRFFLEHLDQWGRKEKYRLHFMDIRCYNDIMQRMKEMPLPVTDKTTDKSGTLVDSIINEKEDYRWRKRDFLQS